MHEETKLKNIVSPQSPQVPAKKQSSGGLAQEGKPWINNSEKEDNAIFSHQLKKFNHTRTGTQDKPLMGDEQQVEVTPQPKHKKSSFSTHVDPPNTERAEKISVPQAPVANNFVLEEASGDSQSKTSA